jgi:hypothetical protein
MINKRHIGRALLAIVATLALNACGAAGSAGANQPGRTVGSTPTYESPTTQATAGADGASSPTAEPAGAGAHEVTIVGSEYAFEAPEQAPAGLITFSFKNQGAAVHHAQVDR